MNNDNRNDDANRDSLTGPVPALIPDDREHQRVIAGLALPHERDESTDAVAEPPDPLMVQARRDIDAGMVDTDMRATPGLDAKLRARLVPGPGGKTSSADARHPGGKS